MDTKITYDVLSNDLIRKIKDIPKTTDTVSTNLTSWVPELIGSSGAILIYHIKDALLEEIRLELLHKFQEIGAGHLYTKMMMKDIYQYTQNTIKLFLN